MTWDTQSDWENGTWSEGIIVGDNLSLKTRGFVRAYDLSTTPIRMHGDEKSLYYTDGRAHYWGPTHTYKVDKDTGKEEIIFSTGGDMVYAEENYLFISNPHGLPTSIWKVNKNTGVQEWSWRGYGYCYGYGVGQHGVYGRGSGRGYSYVRKEDGTVKWTSSGLTRYPDYSLPDLKDEVVVETGLWSPNTVQRVSKIDGNVIWRRSGPTAEMGEVTHPVDITDDAIWIRLYKGRYPYQYFYALAKWDRETGATLATFPELPYYGIWHLGPEGSLIFDYPDERGKALVWNYQDRTLSKVNSPSWEVYWTTDLGYPMEYAPQRPFIDGRFIYLRDPTDSTRIHQYRWKGFTSGSHTTEWREPKPGELVRWETLTATANIPDNTEIIVTVEVSGDVLTISDSKSITLQDGTVDYDISDLQNARYVRIRSDFWTADEAKTPELDLYKITAMPAVILATIDIDPDTLNLKSQGRWITAYIELPLGYDVADIDVASILLQGAVSAEPHPTEIGDHDGDGIPDLMVKFDRSAVQELVDVGEVELVVTGKWHAVLFKGSDVIRVIEPGEGQQGNRPEVPPGQGQGDRGVGGQSPPQTFLRQGGQSLGQANEQINQSNGNGGGHQGRGNSQGDSRGNNSGNNSQGRAKGK